MKPIFQKFKPQDYQQRCLERWDKVIEAAGNADTESKKLTTALVLETTHQDIFNESYTGDGMGSGDSSADGGGQVGSSYVYPGGTTSDSRIPSIVIPTLTRTFPELIAHDLVGIQPMDGPVGFAFAYRRVYGQNRAGVADSTTNEGTEIGYNTIDSAFTGATGLAQQDNSGNYATDADAGSIDPSNDVWQAFGGGASTANGQGAATEDAEWWKINEDWPTAEFRIQKGAVEARTRKLASTHSLELQEDLARMHGIDVNAEAVKMLQWDVKAEIDRQLLGEILKSAINANSGSSHITTWDATKADGRTQIERIGTLYTHILLRSQQIALKTRRGSANWCVTTPTICAMMERLRDYTGFNSDDMGGSSVNTNVGGGVSKVGDLRQGSIGLYRDTFANGDYVALGYKGSTEYDTGVIYCPYIPIQVHRAMNGDGNDFNPRIGIRTRYAVMNNLFGSGDYYQLVKVANINSDLGTNSQVFIQ